MKYLCIFWNLDVIKIDPIKQGSFFAYGGEILSKGFKYPNRYMELSLGKDFPDGLVWWFVDARKSSGQRAWDVRLHWQSEGWLHLDEIDPIPFARNGDWAAFFDGNDHSGDPRVVVVDLGNKKNSYKLPNFDAWLDQALRDSGLK